MLLIDNVFVPRRLLALHFRCPYQSCGGRCCVVGDRGAPVRPNEIERIETFQDSIIPRMNQECRTWMALSGIYQAEGAQLSLQCLHGDGRCVFFDAESDGHGCILERVSREKHITTLRPISCRLFPLRLRQYNGLTILDFEIWNECRDGWDQGPLLLDTCRPALISAFGRSWVEKVDDIRRRLSGTDPKS